MTADLRRYMANYVVHNGKVMVNAVVTVDDEGYVVSVTPFDRETAATSFVDGVMAVVSAEMNQQIEQFLCINKLDSRQTLDYLKQITASSATDGQPTEGGKKTILVVNSNRQICPA